MKEFDIVIVGAGAAGLFAASKLAESGLDVLLLEKKSKLGIKVLVSGAGQCNLSQDEEKEEFIKHFYDKERFVKPSIYALDSHKLTEYLSQIKLKTVVRTDGKVFPKSMKSSDLVNALYSNFKNHIGLVRDTKVDKIQYQNEKFLVSTADEEYSAKKLLLTTGGFTYPSTGSAGDGYCFAESLGHTVVEPRRALSAFTIKDYAFKECAGISLESVMISCKDKSGKRQSMLGNVLFTHKGISGPAVLHLSRYLDSGSMIYISLVQVENIEGFRHNFKSLCQKNRAQEIKTLINTYLPKRLSNVLLQYLQIEASKKISQLNKKELNYIFEALTALPLKVAKLASLEQSMLTAGGVNTKEISAKTMQSRICDGLYFAGELVDVDGESGGYNIHWAFASAALAVENIIKSFSK